MKRRHNLTVSRFIPKEVGKISKIPPRLHTKRNTTDVIGGKPISV
jgi:hypothetical protein